MDPLGALSELNWSSFTGMESANDEAEFMSRLLGSCPFTNAEDYDPNLGLPSAFWSSHEGDHIAVDDANLRCNGTGMVNSSMQCWSEEDSSKLFCKNYYLGDANTAPLMNGGSIMMDNCTVNEQNLSSSLKLVAENLLEDGFCFGEDMNFDHLGESLLHPSGAVDISSQILQPKRKLEAPEPDEARLDKNRTEQSENPKTKSRASGDGQRNGKRSQSKKNHKPVTTTDQEENNAALNGQSSTSYSSEDDDSNASQEFNGGPSSSSKESSDLNINGKTRASRGSATDPQSLYARRRRERINERLKILQNLVPNGTKVDISTMLEEAVHYVKFLQQQIKLLSSDELWMYAPIAYNGMDIGRHDLKISASQ